MYISYAGESNVPGAAGNLFPRNVIAGSPSFQIGPRSPFKGMPQEELNRLKEWDQDPQGLQQYYDRLNAPGPKPFPLPLAYNPFPGTVPMGNAGFFAGPQGAVLNSPTSDFNSLLDQLTNKTLNRPTVPVQSVFPYPGR